MSVALNGNASTALGGTTGMCWTECRVEWELRLLIAAELAILLCLLTSAARLRRLWSPEVLLRTTPMTEVL